MIDQANIFDFSKEKSRLDGIITDWEGKEKEAIITRRKVRANRRNVEEERAKKTILNDETIIPDRTINSNIQRNRAIYINYVTKTKNALIITDLDNPARNMEQLQLWFTRGMHYPSWNVPWITLQDGMQLHGGVALEVVYNPDKPFNVEIEYISRDSLIFPKNTKNLQACSRLIRKYEITSLQLEEFQEKYGFDEAITKKLLDKFDKKDEYIKIYRPLLKKDGIVYNAWYSPEADNAWLRPPVEHQIGLFDFDPEMIKNTIATIGYENWIADEMRMQLAQPLRLKEYPIFWFPLSLEESQILLDVQGRAALDIHEQEALTQMLSCTVNAANRAAQLYPSAESQPGEDSKLMELGQLKPGIIMNRRIVLNQFPWPNNIILSIIQALDIRNAQNSGSADFAAMARKDANKTARELTLANQETQEQQAIDLVTYSNPYLETYALCFLVAQHQAIFGLCKPPPEIDTLFGNYSFQPAGDIEILRKMEDRSNAEKFFEVVRGTPLADKILSFLIDKFFPDYAEEWKAALAQEDNTKLIAIMANILQNVPTEGLPDDQRVQLQSIIHAAQAVVARSGNGQVPGVSPTTPQPVPRESNAVQQS